MPVSIGEIDSTVDVQNSGEASHAGASSATAPSPQSIQRLLDMARRAEELAARTAAWRFED